ncbi:DNA (cytosine-5-)-methyltransferase [Sellimonas caecigallum]|uniref:Cytosine-specific methyltransferase n=1 Tax=Sellimonas caecigallum TaxID=2592333 RepID=A0ABS7L9N1_9FIRM|nr:DNA (cytosine-5-)-methyltransferase [Sellimonas caecigallum]MBY0759796.1 DNA (cytosine-5-)-methyltransferase [Sellimonas caecigallum]
MNRVKEIRKERGMSQETLARYIAISRKYLSMIERQNATPSISIAMRIGGALGVSVDKIFLDLPLEKTPVYPKPIRFIDLFCGIGGFRYASKYAFDKLGLEGKCVFSSDIDKYAQESYEANFGEKPAGDITKIEASEIPDFDFLFAGFPCQAFSICGLQKGFADNTRGTLFFDIARIIKEKRPQAFVLENVKNLASHDNGRTLKTILEVLRDELGYHVDYKLLNALDFGLPQKRERIIIVGSKNPFLMDWTFDIKEKKTLNDILEKNVDKKYYASPEIVAKRKAKHTTSVYPSIWHENKSGNISSYPYSCALRAGASYNYLLVNGERRLTPREMLRLQGFPDSFKIVVSDAQTRKQAGNAIPVDMVAKVIEKFLPLAF